MSKLSTTDLALLVNELSDVTDPYKLGINLGITPARVTIILKEADGNIDRQKSEILTHWLKNDLDASWVKLAQTLRKIDHVRLANSLENKSRVSKQEAEVDNLQGKRAEIRKSEKAAKIEYGQFLYRASKLMEKRKVDLRDVKVTWSGYDSEMSRDACEARDISSFLTAIRSNQGPYAYENVSGLLILFCDEEGEQLVTEYEKKLVKHLRPRVKPVERRGKRFKVKIDREFSRENELDFQNTLATLFECRAVEFILEDVRDGCIELTYVIPAELAGKLKRYCGLQEKWEEFKNAKILELWLESLLLWRSVQSHTSVREMVALNIDDKDKGTAAAAKKARSLFDVLHSKRSRLPSSNTLRSVPSRAVKGDMDMFHYLMKKKRRITAVCLLMVGGLFMWLLMPTLIKYLPGEESDNRNTQMVAEKNFRLGVWCFYFFCVAILWIWLEKSLILMKIHRLYRHCRE